jgi:multisubunit Na+/H+ antiporter MnhC subunit
VTIPFSYAYHDPGTYQATATVTWADGAVRNSTAVAVTVVGAADVVSPLTEWLIAASVVVGAALVACYLLRHRLPESPSLPPRKA